MLLEVKSYIVSLGHVSQLWSYARKRDLQLGFSTPKDKASETVVNIKYSEIFFLIATSLSVASVSIWTGSFVIGSLH